MWNGPCEHVYYFNNVDLNSIRAGYPGKLSFNGQQKVRTQIGLAGKKDETVSELSVGTENLERVRKAISYLYEKFCTGVKRAF
jgi:hypothetical protein